MKRKISDNDLYRLKIVSDPQITPDGSEVAFSLKRIDNNKYFNDIYIVESNSGKCIKLISNSKNNKSPKWSSDGERLAFVSDKSGMDQIWALNKKTDKIEQLTTMKNGAENPGWSSDSKKLLFISNTAEDETYENLIVENSVEEQEKAKDEKQNRIKVINKIFYKLDGVGFFDARNPQIWVLDLENNKYIQITKGECLHSSPAWSPIEDKIVYVHTLNQESLDYHPQKTEMCIYDLELRESRCLVSGNTSISCPSFSPDGKKIAYFAHNIEFGEASFYKLWIYDLETGEKVCITPQSDMTFGNWGLNDVSGLQIMAEPIWSQDGKSIYFIGTSCGNVGIYSTSFNGEIQEVVSGKRQIVQFSMDGKRSTIAFSYSSSSVPGDISLFTTVEKSEKRLTEVNKELLSEIIISEPEEFNVKSSNGWNVQGWIMKPIGFEKGIKYPAILEIHGGPHLMYANSFFFEFQYLAAAGYVVVYSNPCGSSGYSQKFADANRGDYGGVDYKDLMSVTDYAMNFDYIDENRFGVTGGSYGGYMTNWIVTQTNRYKAAVTQRSISNLFTHAGVSDDGMFTCFDEQKVKLENLEDVYKCSPIKYIKNVNTPLLILHSENDYRCPLEQAEQLYINLKFWGRIAQLVIYPNSSHGLSRSGNPVYRIDRLNRIAGWFDKYIK